MQFILGGPCELGDAAMPVKFYFPSHPRVAVESGLEKSQDLEGGIINVMDLTGDDHEASPASEENVPKGNDIMIQDLLVSFVDHVSAIVSRYEKALPFCLNKKETDLFSNFVFNDIISKFPASDTRVSFLEIITARSWADTSLIATTPSSNVLPETESVDTIGREDAHAATVETDTNTREAMETDDIVLGAKLLPEPLSPFSFIAVLNKNDLIEMLLKVEQLEPFKKAKCVLYQGVPSKKLEIFKHNRDTLSKSLLFATNGYCALSDNQSDTIHASATKSKSGKDMKSHLHAKFVCVKGCEGTLSGGLANAERHTVYCKAEWIKSLGDELSKLSAERKGLIATYNKITKASASEKSLQDSALLTISLETQRLQRTYFELAGCLHPAKPANDDKKVESKKGQDVKIPGSALSAPDRSISTFFRKATQVTSTLLDKIPTHIMTSDRLREYMSGRLVFYPFEITAADSTGSVADTLDSDENM